MALFTVKCQLKSVVIYSHPPPFTSRGTGFHPMLLSNCRNENGGNATGFQWPYPNICTSVAVKEKTLSDAPNTALKMSPREFFTFTSMNCFIAKMIPVIS